MHLQREMLLRYRYLVCYYEVSSVVTLIMFAEVSIGNKQQRSTLGQTTCPMPDSALSSILLELPVSVIERTDLSCLQPSRYAVEMEGMLKQVVSDRLKVHSTRLTLQIPHATVHSSLVADD